LPDDDAERGPLLLPPRDEALLLRQRREELRLGEDLARGDPERQDMAKNAARAVHVMGGVLQGVSVEGLRKPATWLALIGRRLLALVEAAIPGTYAHMIRRHALMILYAFAVLSIVLGFVAGFGRPFLRPGLILFGCVLAVDLVVFAITALVKPHKRVREGSVRRQSRGRHSSPR
jgi:hypothetical protein